MVKDRGNRRSLLGRRDHVCSGCVSTGDAAAHQERLDEDGEIEAHRSGQQAFADPFDAVFCVSGRLPLAKQLVQSGWYRRSRSPSSKLDPDQAPRLARAGVARVGSARVRDRLCRGRAGAARAASCRDRF
jgi:hypothetical protein